MSSLPVPSTADAGLHTLHRPSPPTTTQGPTAAVTTNVEPAPVVPGTGAPSQIPSPSPPTTMLGSKLSLTRLHSTHLRESSRSVVDGWTTGEESDDDHPITYLDVVRRPAKPIIASLPRTQIHSIVVLGHGMADAGR